MSDGLVLYSNPMSRGRIARWMVEEIGEPYRVEIVAYGDRMKSSDYLALNPMGKVPCLVHGDQVVTETAAICAYLADAFPDAGLGPRPGERGAYHRWLFFAAGPVEAATTARSLGLEAPAERSGMAGYGSFDLTMDALETAVSRAPFVCGDRFTAADVYVGAQIDFSLRFKSIPARPAFEAYRDRLVEREAYKRAAALDDAAMKELG